MTFSKRPPYRTIAILLLFLSLVLRILSIPQTNLDTKGYLLWYQTLVQEGVTDALATNFSVYTPPYTYLLALATLVRNSIPPLIAIKLIPIYFDLLGAFFIYKIIKLKFQEGGRPVLAAAVYLTAPTVILNSAYWGQIDSLYTSLLLACLYFLMVEKNLPSLLAFGLAFSIKAQAVFFLPFLAVMAIRKRITWGYFGLIPLVYLGMVLPVVFMGRPLLDALFIYAQQSDTFAVLSLNAPNPYILFPREWYSGVLTPGIAAALIMIVAWVYTTARSKRKPDGQYLILLALISTALMPYLLPKMHDRYFYPADVLSIVLAFYWPALWFIPVLFQLISLSAISNFLFGTSPSLVIFGFLLNTIVLATLLRTQRLAEGRSATDKKVTSVLSWFTALLTPIILFGVSLNFLLTPVHLRLEYAMPHIPADTFGFNRSERFQWAAETLNHLTSTQPTRALSRYRFEDGSPVFQEHEITLLDQGKTALQNILVIWRLTLAALFMLGIFAWAGDWLAKFIQGLKRGAWFTMGAAIIPAVALILLNGFQPNALFQNSDTLLRLFPFGIWRNSLLFMVISLVGGGFLLTMILAKIKNDPTD